MPPGKSWKVLELFTVIFPGPGKSCNLLDVDGESNDADTDAKIWHKPALTYAISVFTLH